VLGADTEERGSVAKYATEKLEVYESDWCNAGIAGAGNFGDLIDTVVEAVRRGLDQDKPRTFKSAQKSISASLVQVHENEVQAFPSSQPEHKIVELLIALRPRKEETAALWAASATALHPVRGGHDVRGVGEAMRFISSRLYRNNLTLMQGVLLCAHLLNVSKRYVTDIGGDSHILVLTSGGWIQKEAVKETELSETFLEYFDAVSRDLFFAYADTSLQEHEFEGKLQRFVLLVRRLRGELCTQFTKHHLSWMLTDPMYVGDPYRKLPDGAEIMMGPIRADYSFFDHITVDDPDVRINPNSPRHTRRRKVKYKTDDHGQSKVSVSPSGSPSLSPSASISPSVSVSPSDEPELDESMQGEESE
jgi:hypothetical protein